jgi:hypothetical protein
MEAQCAAQVPQKRPAPAEGAAPPPPPRAPAAGARDALAAPAPAPPQHALFETPVPPSACASAMAAMIHHGSSGRGDFDAFWFCVSNNGAGRARREGGACCVLAATAVWP